MRAVSAAAFVIICSATASWAQEVASDPAEHERALAERLAEARSYAQYTGDPLGTNLRLRDARTHAQALGRSIESEIQKIRQRALERGVVLQLAQAVDAAGRGNPRQTNLSLANYERFSHQLGRPVSSSKLEAIRRRAYETRIDLDLRAAKIALEHRDIDQARAAYAEARLWAQEFTSELDPALRKRLNSRMTRRIHQLGLRQEFKRELAKAKSGARAGDTHGTEAALEQARTHHLNRTGVHPIARLQLAATAHQVRSELQPKKRRAKGRSRAGR
jgi:hypothetical protein